MKMKLLMPNPGDVVSYRSTLTKNAKVYYPAIGEILKIFWGLRKDGSSKEDDAEVVEINGNEITFDIKDDFFASLLPYIKLQGFYGYENFKERANGRIVLEDYRLLMLEIKTDMKKIEQDNASSYVQEWLDFTYNWMNSNPPDLRARDEPSASI